MGRRREFDVDEVLDSVLCVFWHKGYEGASYTDLTQAAGVERPALYSAFGNKEALFRQALKRYYERHLNFFPEALKLPTSREVAAHILYSAAELHTRYPDCKGCLGTHGVLAGSDDAEPVRRTLIAARRAGESSLRKRLERAKEEGDLPEDADCATLAAFVMTMTHGMAVQAKAGFSHETLRAIADQALSTWPSKPVSGDPAGVVDPQQGRSTQAKDRRGVSN
ncbi:TetR/AcrR family transcriptional regulator [Natronospirillum operosum]|uniref:TetR/AcrR family transcriptional regulator n=1 Tax=Natronospirillum operosum TaxID=2759953 RepID=A0A4Z0W6F7_9GAMM|nr:TetR/AcrR family transcriptional regulator [Natronospirillum operosum]TGG91723.1 TetR/AcrR family transcriptional regulator [Natronospirillum operosum]